MGHSIDAYLENLKTAERIGSRYVYFQAADARKIIDIAQAASDWHQAVKAGHHDKMAELRCLMVLRDCIEKMEGEG